MRDITSGHLRSSGRTEHLCLGLLGTLWFTRDGSPGLSDASTGKHLFVSFFYLLGLLGPLQPVRHHFPSVWGLKSS